MPTRSSPGPFHTADELPRAARRGDAHDRPRLVLVRGWTPIAKVVQRIRGNRRIRPATQPPTAGRSMSERTDPDADAEQATARGDSHEHGLVTTRQRPSVRYRTWVTSPWSTSRSSRRS